MRARVDAPRLTRALIEVDGNIVAAPTWALQHHPSRSPSLDDHRVPRISKKTTNFGARLYYRLYRKDQISHLEHA
jgi:hypothetical protein